MYWFDCMFSPIDYTMGGNDMKWKKLTKWKNSVAYQNWFMWAVQKAFDRYVFEDLPETVSERVLKYALLWNAGCSFFERNGSLMAMPGNPGGNKNTNGDWLNGWAYSANGDSWRLRFVPKGAEEDPDLLRGVYGRRELGGIQAVYVRENEKMFPFIWYCMDFAQEIADSWRKISVARRNAANPYVVFTVEQLLPTIKKAFNDRNQNEEVIVLDSGIATPDKVLIQPIEVSVETLKAHTDLIEWYMNQFNALCGVYSNASPDKKERLLVDEVNANNQSNDANIDGVIRCLSEGLDQVNKVFGTNISVRKAYEITNYQPEKMDASKSYTVNEAPAGGDKA